MGNRVSHLIRRLIMAWSSAIVGRPAAYMPGKLVSWGSWTADGVTAGDIDTGLHRCEFISLTPYGSSTALTHISVTDTLPHDGSAVGIDIGTSIDVDGYWWAMGY